MSGQYFSHLTKGLSEMLGEVLKEEGLGLFRKAPQVQVGSPMSELSTDYHLYFLGKEFLESDSGTFTCPSESGSFLVFRNPVRLCATFLLLGNGLLSQNKIRSYDKLMAFFFDNARIEPIIPESYKVYPALYDRLVSTKAEIKTRGDLAASSRALTGSATQMATPNHLDGFRMVLDYTAQYHSGTLLKEENRVKSRVIEYATNANERSVL